MGDPTHIVELIDQVLNETQDQPQLQEKILDLRDALFQAQQSSQQYALKIKILEEEKQVIIVMICHKNFTETETLSL